MFSPIYLTVLYLSTALAVSVSTVSSSDTITTSRRQVADDGSEPGVLIGDLRTQITTPVGQAIADILTGNNGEALSSVIGTQPARECPKAPVNRLSKARSLFSQIKTSNDPCCHWYSISRELTNKFRGRSGRCNDMARAAIRLGFHDAGTWSMTTESEGGGADGSFLLFNEKTRSENRGLEGIDAYARKLLKKYPVGAADLIQYMAIHATVTCPLGPRIRMFVGRKDATKASPDSLLPPISGSADFLISLFEDKTIRPHDLAALLGAHSTSKQFFVDQSHGKVGKPQDTSPGIWDVKFYNETLQANPAKGTFRFLSDQVLSRDSRLRDEWVSFIDDQHHWNEDYASAYTRLSLLGVGNINDLVECTATLPAARSSYKGMNDGDDDDE